MRGIMVDLLRVHGLDHADVVGNGADKGKEIRDFEAGTPAALEFDERPARLELAILQLGELLAFGERCRKGLVVNALQFRLEIKSLQMRWAARHAEMDHPSCPGRSMGWTNHCRPGAVQQGSQRHAANAVSGAP